MINDAVKGTLKGEFLIRKLEEKLTKKGKPYWDLTLSDSSGTILAKIWNVNLCVRLQPLDVISCSGEVSEYQGELQYTISEDSVTVLPDADKTEFCPRTPYSTEKMWGMLLDILQEVENPWCKSLLNSFVEDTDFVEKFCRSSAAVTVHHDYVGGLLEHTLFIIRTAKRVCGIYTWLNKDLLITSAFLHDIGKMKEISEFPENQYTNFGYCVGHVTGSALMVASKCDAIEGFPEDVKLKIIHCILAHHGKLEYGSPKVPALPEVLVLSELDNLDAKLKIFEGAVSSGDWKSYNRYLETYAASGEFHEDEC